jgi:hypothetical protein
MKMGTGIGYLDGEPFVSALEQAQAEGRLGFVEANMPRLEWLIARYQDRAYELAQLQYRAQMVRRRYEPRAERRR